MAAIEKGENSENDLKLYKSVNFTFFLFICIFWGFKIKYKYNNKTNIVSFGIYTLTWGNKTLNWGLQDMGTLPICFPLFLKERLILLLPVCFPKRHCLSKTGDYSQWKDSSWRCKLKGGKIAKSELLLLERMNCFPLKGYSKIFFFFS